MPGSVADNMIYETYMGPAQGNGGFYGGMQGAYGGVIGQVSPESNPNWKPSSYNLGTASQMYGDVTKGYSGAIKNWNETTGRIEGGYGELAGAQQGFGDSQREALRRQFGGAYGQMNLAASSRGLGNTSLALNMQRGVAADEAFANLQLSDYIRDNLNQIEMARLGYLGNAQQGAGQLQSQRLNYMGQSALNKQDEAAQRKMLQKQLDQQLKLQREQQAFQKYMTEPKTVTKTYSGYAGAFGEMGTGRSVTYPNPSNPQPDFIRNFVQRATR